VKTPVKNPLKKARKSGLDMTSLGIAVLLIGAIIVVGGAIAAGDGRRYLQMRRM
jgi:hypothetical protein